MVALIGNRVYRAGGKKFDEIGPFEGWSKKYDYWSPIYSPRI